MLPFGQLKRFFWPLVLAGMAILLASVAVLQYRWTEEASTAAEMRIGTELQSLMMKWHNDLYLEFSAVCIALQVGPDSGARDTWNDYLERYTEWRNALSRQTLINIYSNPDLVRDVYVWDTNLGAKPQLFRLNADQKKIEAVDTPEDLQTLLARLRANSTDLSTSLRVWQSPGHQGGSAPSDSAVLANSAGSTGWQFDQTVPAIVHPIFQRDGRSLTSRTPVDWMVISLNSTALEKRVFPELATRYFGGLAGLDYKLAVVATGPAPKTIYSSDSGFGVADLPGADSTMDIFGLPPNSIESRLGQIGNAPSPHTDWHSFSGPVWFPVIQYDSQDNPWLLILQRRTAPVQDLVRSIRRKNLALSSVVLLLLAISIGVLITAGFRAQTFAQMQMDFVASISHELRTPLAAIFSAGENIKDGVVNSRSSMARYGSIVIDQSRQLMDHVDRILLFASIRSGKDRYNLRPLFISEILGRVRRTVMPLLIQKSCTLEEFIEPDLPPVFGDLLAVSSCLENLITNAVKYSGQNRRIRLAVILRADAPESREVLISVEDYGIGIAPSELKSIFKPFYRSPSVSAAQIHGTGLGLSLAKHLAQAMGGALTVSSEVGVGSIFTLHLKATPVTEPELSAVSSSVTRSEGK